MTIIFVLAMIYGVFSIFCDLSSDENTTPLDIFSQTPDIRNNLAAQFYICHIILFIIVIFVTYFGEVDNTVQGSEDFENFKNLLKQEGLQWSDLFQKPKNKN